MINWKINLHSPNQTLRNYMSKWVLQIDLYYHRADLEDLTIESNFYYLRVLFYAVGLVLKM